MRADRYVLTRGHQRWGNVVGSRRRETLAVPQLQEAKIRLADTTGVLEHFPEYGIKLAGGRADYLQYFRSRGLLLQRFLGLVEQPHILDGDDSLVGEGLHQLHVVGSKLAGRFARNADHADRQAS